ncbi:MAG: DNA methyltransferase [Bacteroidaceae bacterium]|nr:DNA methyltransferase [Bacteroidaceae bacterium]
MSKKSEKLFNEIKAALAETGKDNSGLLDRLGGYLNTKDFGLVFERNLPDDMRLYGKPIVKGDMVHILPSRGSKESESNRIAYPVSKVDAAMVTIVMPDGSSQSMHKDDLVPVTSYDTPIYAGLHETGRVVHDGADGSEGVWNAVINGENFHALEMLLFPFAGKVDAIYIDPPYNTGARDWKYNNSYVDKSDGYPHSKWLAMMERRLKLAKKLLNPSKSVLICTIDEKEYLNLGLLLNDIFPDARVQMISSVINPHGSARKQEFKRTDEYVYFVMLGDATPVKVVDIWNKKDSSDSVWFPLVRGDLREDRPNLFYPIYVKKDMTGIDSIGSPLPLGIDRKTVDDKDDCYTVFPVKTNGEESYWQVSPSNLEVLISKGFVKVSQKNGKVSISYIREGKRQEIENGEYTIIGNEKDGSIIIDYSSHVKKIDPGTQWNFPSHAAGTYGTGILRSLMPGRKFPYPKSLYAVEDALRFFVQDNPDALILDFFAGSGTTAHAVMRLNHQDGGRRRTISVTNNEISDKEEMELTKSKHRKGDPEWESKGICRYITIPRITAALTGITSTGASISGSYKFIDEFPMKDGFKENFVFYDMAYMNPDDLERNAPQFSDVDALLWMRAGMLGAPGSAVVDTKNYMVFREGWAVLFDYAGIHEFESALASSGIQLKTLFFVTDNNDRFRKLAAKYEGCNVVQLYKSMLRSFQIAAETV